MNKFVRNHLKIVIASKFIFSLILVWDWISCYFKFFMQTSFCYSCWIVLLLQNTSLRFLGNTTKSSSYFLSTKLTLWYLNLVPGDLVKKSQWPPVFVCTTMQFGFLSKSVSGSWWSVHIGSSLACNTRKGMLISPIKRSLHTNIKDYYH